MVVLIKRVLTELVDAFAVIQAKITANKELLVGKTDLAERLSSFRSQLILFLNVVLGSQILVPKEKKAVAIAKGKTSSVPSAAVYNTAPAETVTSNSVIPKVRSTTITARNFFYTKIVTTSETGRTIIYVVSCCDLCCFFYPCIYFCCYETTETTYY